MIAVGNRYTIKRVERGVLPPRSRLGAFLGATGNTTVELDFTYAGSERRPDPFADRIGQPVDFDILCELTPVGFDTVRADVLESLSPSFELLPY